jgi:hypothetical protein
MRCVDSVWLSRSITFYLRADQVALGYGLASTMSPGRQYKNVDNPGSALGFQACPRRRGEDVVGFGGSGAYCAALEVGLGARVGRSIALSSSQTQSHSITRGSLNQGVMPSWEASKRPPQICPQTTCDLILSTCPSEVRAQSRLNSSERRSKLLAPPFLIGGNDASL